MRRGKFSERGISPVIGVSLFIVIVTILAAVVGYLFLGLSDETDPQPDAVIRIEPTDDNITYVLHHVSGDSLSGNQTELAGVADDEALHGKRINAGEKVEVVPVAEEVTLYWRGENTDYRLQTFTVDDSPLVDEVGDIDKKCEWAEDNINKNGDLDMSGDETVCDVTEETDTGISDINIDIDSDSTLIGNIDTDGDVDVDSSLVAGDITTDADDITITGKSDIYGDVVAQSDTNIDIDGDSTVTGAVVVRGGSLSLDSVDIEGHVYADESDLSCSSATIGPNDEDCSAYDPRDPSNY